jgi:predicted nucleic acid-binding protein
MPKEKNKPLATNAYVLDSYALLAYLEDESGSERIQELLESAKDQKCRLFMCVVNLGEVMYILKRERGMAGSQPVLALVNTLPLIIIDADYPLTVSAADIKTICPISYADCYAAALSQVKKAILVTGDPEFRKIDTDPPLQIEWLPEKTL